MARTVVARSDARLDCAAALLEAGVAAVSGILELGPLAVPVLPQAGMRVIKSGSETGVTEGLISDVTGDRVVIDQLPGHPADYDLSQMGDSGAAWIERSTGAPVALHTAGNSLGREQAFGVSMPAVLARLALRVA